MSTISRRIPQTNKTIAAAMAAAKAKLVLVGPLDDTLRESTKTDLNAQAGPIALGLITRAGAKAAQGEATANKNAQRRILLRLTTQFIQIFKFWVERGKAVASDRAYYQLDENTGNIPPVAKDSELQAVALALINGETLRIAAGKPPMVDIELADMQDAYDNFVDAMGILNTKKQAYDAAQEAFTALCNTARPVVLSIWDEVESKYNKEPKESQRANAMLWGVIFKNQGTASVINFNVTKFGEPLVKLENVDIRGEEGDVEGFTDVDGKLTLNDNFHGLETFTLELAGYVIKTITQELAEGGVYNISVEMVEI